MFRTPVTSWAGRTSALLCTSCSCSLLITVGFLSGIVSNIRQKISDDLVPEPCLQMPEARRSAPLPDLRNCFVSACPPRPNRAVYSSSLGYISIVARSIEDIYVMSDCNTRSGDNIHFHKSCKAFKQAAIYHNDSKSWITWNSCLKLMPDMSELHPIPLLTMPAIPEMIKPNGDDTQKCTSLITAKASMLTSAGAEIMRFAHQRHRHRSVFLQRGCGRFLNI